jgi:isopentenyl diphosphate isomerase/L-lactate dehydrogenase-like FMN-dependent dehydrogenase
MRAARATTVADVVALGRRRLPRSIAGIVDSGADGEVTVRGNAAAFERLRLRPRALVDVSERDLSTSVAGSRVALPVLLAPTGAPALVHRGAEPAVARAAGRAGTIYVQATTSSRPLAEVARAASGPLWFQLYLARDRALTEALVDRAAGAGFRALCLTVDSAVAGSRTRDLRTRLPARRWAARLAAGSLRHPRWAARVLPANLRGAVRLLHPARTRVPARPVTAGEIAWLRARWAGPLLVKGVMAAEPCARLLDLGVDGIVVSNHGGRQLDTLPAAIEVLPEVVAAVGGRAEVLVDGGVRRGTDVLAALALGARAVLVGRPYLYGLAAGGEDGVVRVLDILRDELDRALALAGCRSVADVGPDLLRTAGPAQSARPPSTVMTCPVR